MANPYYKANWIEIDAERQRAYDQSLAYHPALEPFFAGADTVDGRLLCSGRASRAMRAIPAKSLAPKWSSGCEISKAL